jgi:hypothetical protein
MKELIRANDPVLLSYVASLLDDAGIDHLMLDGHMSVLEGSLGILQRRVLVAEDDFAQARRILSDNGLTGELREERR